jgi:DNA-binding CsgD family transcriptional regulator
MAAGAGQETARLADLAMMSRNRRWFREQLLDMLDRAVGFDKGSIHGVRAGVGDTCARGYERPAAFDELPRYMAEFEPQEIAAASAGRPIIDTETLCARRRERLSIYHQFLRPERVTVFTTVMWRTDQGASGITLARTGRGARFGAGAVRTLELLLPAIRLADALVGLQQREAVPPVFDAWADDAGLSAREREVTRLVVRGLENREIAAVLGVSSHTVRNQLVSIFRKADVSTRAELVFVAATFEPPRAAVPRNAPWLQHIR